MPSQWVIAPSWSDVSHTGSKSIPISSSFGGVRPWVCSFTCLIIFHCLVAWISISTCCLFPICVAPWGPKCWCTFGTFWHCLLRVCSQCCQCGSRQLLTQSVSPSEPWLPAHQSQDLVSLFQWVLCCQPPLVQGGGCSVVGLPRNMTFCTLEQLFNLRQLLVGVL